MVSRTTSCLSNNVYPAYVICINFLIYFILPAPKSPLCAARRPCSAGVACARAPPQIVAVPGAQTDSGLQKCTGADWKVRMDHLKIVYLMPPRIMLKFTRAWNSWKSIHYCFQFVKISKQRHGKRPKPKCLHFMIKLLCLTNLKVFFERVFFRQYHKKEKKKTKYNFNPPPLHPHPPPPPQFDDYL